MNIFCNLLNSDRIQDGKIEHRFPLIYFWLKDYYYQQSPENFKKIKKWQFNEDKIPLKENSKLQKQLKENPPDIITLSLYMWNVDLLLENAKWIKKKFPNCVIIAGGPNAENNRNFFQKHTYIDYVIIGPGAEIFRRIVDAKFNNTPLKEVDGVSYWNGNEVVINAPVPRHQDPFILNYINNFRDEVLELLDYYSKKYFKVIFTTMYVQGCPYSCSFCEQGTKIWTKIHKRNIQHVYDEIDLLANYDNLTIEFADANFGIVPEYEDILDYICQKTNGKNLKLEKDLAMAKNNTDFTFKLLDKMAKYNLIDSPNASGYITLQDINQEVLKINGRPWSKENEKIKRFQSYTKDETYKSSMVEMIIGMPGQSYKSLSNSLQQLMKLNLVTNYVPYLYLVLPNTWLTSENNTVYFKSAKTSIRNHFNDNDGRLIEGSYYPNTITTRTHLIETKDITSKEITSTFYYWTFINHSYGFLNWLQVFLIFLKNHHNVPMEKFMEKFTETFHPNNWHNLPDNIKQDLESWHKWFIGEDQFFQRKDNTNKYFLVPQSISKYRFHSNYEEFETVLQNILESLMGQNCVHLQPLLKWQKAKITRFDSKTHTNTIISYNYDDIAQLKTETFWKSKFTFTHNETDVLKKLINVEDINYVPTTSVAKIDSSVQKELTLSKKLHSFA